MAGSTNEVLRRILSERRRDRVDDSSLTPAGVMALLYHKDGLYCILLNRRSDSVKEHKGEISFPGGRVEAEDGSLLNTALRETHEEIGIRSEDIEQLGELGQVATTPNYVISSFVGTITQPYAYSPNGDEVAELLEIPVAELSDPSNTRDDVRIVDGRLDIDTSYAYQGNLIFGATAKILSRILEALNSVADEEAPWRRR